jgi:transposase
MTFRDWLTKYKAEGECSFIRTGSNKYYSSEFKKTVIKDYLTTQYSLSELTIKYKILSTDAIRKLVLKYNGNEKLKDSGRRIQNNDQKQNDIVLQAGIHWLQ